MLRVFSLFYQLDFPSLCICAVPVAAPAHVLASISALPLLRSLPPLFLIYHRILWLCHSRNPPPETAL